jgi:hypothetical protein
MTGELHTFYNSTLDAGRCYVHAQTVLTPSGTL